MIRCKEWDDNPEFIDILYQVYIHVLEYSFLSPNHRYLQKKVSLNGSTISSTPTV